MAPGHSIDYPDFLNVSIKVVEAPGAVPSDVFVVDSLDIVGVETARDEVLAALTELTDDESLAEAYRGRDTPIPGLHVPSVLNTSRTLASWDGSGPIVEQVVLQIAEWSVAGAVGNAAWEAIKATQRRIAKRPSSGTHRPLSRDDALGLAHWGLSEQFGLPTPVDYVADERSPGGIREVRDTSLVLVDEVMSPDSWTFRWQRQGYEYEVTVEKPHGYNTITYYRRRLITD